MRSRFSSLSAGSRGCVFVAVLGAAALSGCDPELVVNPNVVTEPPATGPATVYFVNAMPDAPTIDVYLDGMVDKAPKSIRLSGLTYRTAVQAVKDLAPTTYKLEIRPGGAAATSMPVLTQSLTVQAGRKVLLTAMGRVGDTTGATKPALSSADLGTPSGKGVKLRLLHASPSAPLVDLMQESNNLIQSAEFGKTSYYTEVGELAKDAKLHVRPAGGTEDYASVTVPSKFAVGSVVTAIAFGEINPLVSEEAFLHFAVFDESMGMAMGTLTEMPMEIATTGKAHLIAVHASPDAPAVDLFNKNGDKMVSGLAYYKASVELERDGGKYEIDVKPAGMMTTLTSATLRLLPSTNWMVYGAGRVADQSLKLYAVPRGEKSDATQLRIVHAASGVAPFDVKAGTMSVVSKLAYPRASGFFAAELQGNVLKFVTTTDPKKAWDATVPQALLNSGEVVSLIAAGIPGDPMKPFTVFSVTESLAKSDKVAPTDILFTITSTPPM